MNVFMMHVLVNGLFVANIFMAGSFRFPCFSFDDCSRIFLFVGRLLKAHPAYLCVLTQSRRFPFFAPNALVVLFNGYGFMGRPLCSNCFVCACNKAEQLCAWFIQFEGVTNWWRAQNSLTAAGRNETLFKKEKWLFRVPLEWLYRARLVVCFSIVCRCCKAAPFATEKFQFLQQSANERSMGKWKIEYCNNGGHSTLQGTTTEMYNTFPALHCAHHIT